jgi:Zn-dependent protease with chaperone function
MSIKNRGDLYEQMRRNRLRLYGAVALHSLIATGLSALILLAFFDRYDVSPGFWFWLSLLWLLFLLYALLRYALGGHWILSGLEVLPPRETDVRLSDALEAAMLAAGMRERVRLFCIPNNDINAFSLSVPDGTFALFATTGIAEKLPQRERVAILAHELSHMMAGDAIIYTVMLRLAGRRAMRKMVRGAGAGDDNPFLISGASSGAVGLAIAPLLFLGIYRSDGVFNENLSGVISSGAALFAVAFSLVLLLFVASMPAVIFKLFQLLLDRRREYSADLHAAFLTRDPEATYLAVKHAAEDVRDVMILPACFDALLFHPVRDFTSYNPFGTQPTMADRVRNLKESFPSMCFDTQP